ncbi:MAG: (2Fe-2S)-binding protein [Dehalococcoidia bacterium]
MDKRIIRLTVNGEEHQVEISAKETLLEVLRERLSLTGAKEGCQDGSCGACTILLDGKPARACLVLAAEAEGKDILTIEGLSRDNELHPIQEAFIHHGGIQCGFCTPGMILTAKALVDSNPEPTEAEIEEAISGNLCRCTGYAKIVESIIAATKRG